MTFIDLPGRDAVRDFLAQDGNVLMFTNRSAILP